MSDRVYAGAYRKRVRAHTPHPSKQAKTSKAKAAATQARTSPPRDQSSRPPSSSHHARQQQPREDDFCNDIPNPKEKKRAQKRPAEADDTSGEDHEDVAAPAKKRRKSSDDPKESRSAPPPPRKRAPYVEDVEDEDEDEEPVEDLDPALLWPTWADPLVKLDARASQATRTENEYQDVYLACRVIKRFLGPGLAPDRVIAYAVTYHNVLMEDRPCNMTADPHPDDELEITCRAFPQYFPNWDNAVIFLKKDPSLIIKLGRYIEKVGGKTRSDDLARMKSHVLWAAGISDPKGTLTDKSNRGARNHQIARLLTPLSKLERFDADPDQFCEDILNGSQKLHSLDWWSGVYDLSRAKPGHYRPGLLMSPFAVKLYDAIWTSRKSGEYETTTGKKKKGQPSLSKKYNVKEVTLHSILYVLGLARFCLNSQSEWSDVDGAWKVAEFNKSIVQFAMKNLKWHEALIKWWTRQIYGDDHEEAMTVDDYQQTSFYQAMTYECDDDVEDDFEDRPAKSKPKPRPVSRRKAITVEPVSPIGRLQTPQPRAASSRLQSPAISPLRHSQALRSPSPASSSSSRSRSPSAGLPEVEDEFVKPFSDDYGIYDDPDEPLETAEAKLFNMFQEDDPVVGGAELGLDKTDEDSRVRSPFDDGNTTGSAVDAFGHSPGKDNCAPEAHATAEDLAEGQGTGDGAGGLTLEGSARLDRGDSLNNVPRDETLDAGGGNILDAGNSAAAVQSVPQASPSGSRAASEAPQNAARALLKALNLGGADEEEDARMMAMLLKQVSKLKPTKKGTRKSARKTG